MIWVTTQREAVDWTRPRPSGPFRVAVDRGVFSSALRGEGAGVFWSGLYNVLFLTVALFAAPWYGGKMLLTGKYRRSLGPKFGRLARSTVALFAGRGTPRIWVHAVSVGEVTAAAPIVAALRARFPKAFLAFSTSTETGQAMAKKIIPEATVHFYYPLDLPCVVRKVISLVDPDIFVPVETEIWPNFIQICQERGTAIVMVNGRISPRSFGRYRATRFFWKRILAHLDDAGVISSTDGERLAALGVPPQRIQPLGNAKYDGLAARVSPELAGEIAGHLGVTAGDQVLVAGSTHAREEAVILRVYQRLLEIWPEFKLILIPRHVERADAVVGIVRHAGFSDLIRMTQINAGQLRRDQRVVVVDVIGELFKLYSLATVVFCGGSLVPKGGQNILEAAAWGKVVFYGPHMEDFLQERALLEAAGGGIMVRDGEALYQGIRELLEDPDRLRRKGEAGRAVIAANRGAAERHAALIVDVLCHRPCRK